MIFLPQNQLLHSFLTPLTMDCGEMSLQVVSIHWPSRGLNGPHIFPAGVSGQFQVVAAIPQTGDSVFECFSLNFSL